MFEQFVVTTGRPYVWCHARTKWSAPALEAEYGEFGAYGVVSVNKPSSPSDPNTSSVEIWWKRNAALRSAGKADQ